MKREISRFVKSYPIHIVADASIKIPLDHNTAYAASGSVFSLKSSLIHLIPLTGFKKPILSILKKINTKPLFLQIR